MSTAQPPGGAVEPPLSGSVVVGGVVVVGVVVVVVGVVVVGVVVVCVSVGVVSVVVSVTVGWVTVCVFWHSTAARCCRLAAPSARRWRSCGSVSLGRLVISS